MTQLHVLCAYYFFKFNSLAVCIYFIAELASQGKDGWGWLVFLALCISSSSMTYTKD